MCGFCFRRSIDSSSRWNATTGTCLITTGGTRSTWPKSCSQSWWYVFVLWVRTSRFVRTEATLFFIMFFYERVQISRQAYYNECRRGRVIFFLGMWHEEHVLRSRGVGNVRRLSVPRSRSPGHEQFVPGKVSSTSLMASRLCPALAVTVRLRKNKTITIYIWPWSFGTSVIILT